MHKYEDEDIKIFGAKKIENEADVLIRIVEIMKNQRANGNMDRAKLLGETVAHKIYYELMNEYKGKMSVSVPEVNADSIMEQMIKLITFTVEAELHILLDKYSVSTMTVNAFYDELIKLDEDLYDNITDAFTYYYLVLRKGGDIAVGLGKQFAKLCGDKTNERLQYIGAEIFDEVCALLKNEIEKAEFVND
ncbi:MAG: hypothetical protein IJ279_05670 [Clostridia bacterium]|nr:hypothetical protein [Clostridia bacterium]